MNNHSDKPPNIMIVSANKTNCQMLGKFLEKYNYKTMEACTLEEIETALNEKHDEISLALIDLGGYDSRIWQQCETLRQQGIPFMLFSPFPNPKLSQESMKSGAKAVLVKPLIMKELLFYIQNFLKEETE